LCCSNPDYWLQKLFGKQVGVAGPAAPDILVFSDEKAANPAQTIRARIDERSSDFIGSVS
jgi:hypothetical protein